MCNAKKRTVKLQSLRILKTILLLRNRLYAVFAFFLHMQRKKEQKIKTRDKCFEKSSSQLQFFERSNSSNAKICFLQLNQWYWLSAYRSPSLIEFIRFNYFDDLFCTYGRCMCMCMGWCGVCVYRSVYFALKWFKMNDEKVILRFTFLKNHPNTQIEEVCMPSNANIFALLTLSNTICCLLLLPDQQQQQHKSLF